MDPRPHPLRSMSKVEASGVFSNKQLDNYTYKKVSANGLPFAAPFTFEYGAKVPRTSRNCSSPRQQRRHTRTRRLPDNLSVASLLGVSSKQAHSNGSNQWYHSCTSRRKLKNQELRQHQRTLWSCSSSRHLLKASSQQWW